MIYSTQDLYLKYNEYKTPHIKIQTEVNNKRLIPIVQGLYEDDKNTAGYKLVSYIEPNAYLSFEYVLYLSGLIQKRVNTFTAATSIKENNKVLRTFFGNYFFRDIPKQAYMHGVKQITEDGYTYLIATPEKALCDLLCKKNPVCSVKEIEVLLFEELKIDEAAFLKLNKNNLIFLCSLYRKKNLNYLKKYVEKFV